MDHMKSGAWLAGTMILSLIGVIAMVRGVILILPHASSPDSHSSLLGWSALVLGSAATLCTVHVSYRLFAGCCVIGALRLIFLLATEVFYANVRYPRQSLFLGFLFCALFVWFAIKVEGMQFTVLDRIAATFAPLLLYWSSRSGQSVSVIAVQLTVVLVLLLAAGLTRHKHLPSDSKWLLR